MSSDTRKTRVIIQEANEWLLEMVEPGARPEDEAEFAAWLRQSPVHVREYLGAEAVYAAVAGVDAERQIDVAALLVQDDRNVIELGQQAVDCAGWEARSRAQKERDSSNPSASRLRVLDQQDCSRSLEPATRVEDACWVGGGGVPPAAGPGRPRRWATAATIILAIAAAAALYVQNSMPEVYATARGEQRRLILADGSVIDMNTETELSVRINDDTRRVEVIKGEALFTVAKDPWRPFVVDGDLARVRALGTQFNVYRQPKQMLVTVIEGRVAVEQEAARRTSIEAEVAMVEVPAVELSAGDQAAIGAQEPIRKTAANAEQALAWRERRLIFENRPLAEVVAEFNRYNRRQLVIEDASLAEERISAVFDADQPEALVRFLIWNMSIETIEAGDQRLVLRADE